MEIVVSLLYILLFLFIMKKWRFFHLEGISYTSISFVFILKILFGILLYLIYYYYYGNDRFNSDAFKYFDDSLIIFEELKNKPIDFIKILSSYDDSNPKYEILLKNTSFWYKEYNYGMYNDNRTLIRLNLLIRLFSFGYYQVHSIFMCFISLIGLVSIYKAFYIFFKRIKNLLFIVVFLIPTVLFWGSSVLKEGIVLFAIGTLFYSLSKIYFKLYTYNTFIVLAFSIFLLTIMKIYLLLSLTPMLLFFFVTRAYSKHQGLIFVAIHLLCIIVAFNLKHIDDSYDIPQYLMMKQGDFINVANDAKAGSYFEIDRVENNFLSFLAISPIAFVNTLFRPFLWEAHNPLALFNSIENLVLFFIPTLLLIYVKTPKSLHKFWIYALSSYTIILYTIIGITVPVAGAMVRYKLPGIPFVLILFLLLMNQQKLKEIKWLKKLLDLKL